MPSLRNTHFLTLACLAVVLVVAAGEAVANIGINVTTMRDGTVPDSEIVSGDSTGFIDQSDWNNELAPFTADGDTFVFDDGMLTGTSGETATITNNGPTGNWRTQDLDGAGFGATNYLFDGYLEGSVEQGTLVSFTVDGLDEPSFSGGYDVIVYFGIESGTRNGFVGINAETPESIVVTAKYDSFDDDPLDGDGINTYVFSGVTGSSFTVTAQGDTTADRFGIAGLQIINDGGSPPVIGDTNGDGIVDLETDFAAIRDNFLLSPATKLQGDLTGADIVDLEDFLLWRSNHPFPTTEGQIATGAFAAPEPSSCMLTALGLLAIGTRTRRKK